MDASPQLSLVPDPDDGAPGPGEPGGIVLTIDCDDCTGRATACCDDCMVSHLLGHPDGTRVEFDRDEYRQVELLTAAGLVPASRFRSRHASA